MLSKKKNVGFAARRGGTSWLLVQLMSPGRPLRKHYLLWICLVVSTRLKNVSDTQISVPSEKTQLLSGLHPPPHLGGDTWQKKGCLAVEAGAAGPVVWGSFLF